MSGWCRGRVTHTQEGMGPSPLGGVEPDEEEAPYVLPPCRVETVECRDRYFPGRRLEQWLL